jgi:hypothetical protein
MIPTLSIETNSLAHTDQKIFAIRQFLQQNPSIELQDIYRWLYYGEFGYEEESSYLKEEKARPQLIRILDDVKFEKKNNVSPPVVWEPMGLAQRFIMVFLTPYSINQCPINRIVNLIERAPAFRGTRMHFKLDWAFIKDFLIRKEKLYIKQDFYNFEDRINFHHLPDVPFTEDYITNKPFKYRIVPRKLFFDFFPEFDDKKDILPTPPKDSLIY